MGFPPHSLADSEAPPRALVDAWREEPIDPARIQRAYLRFLGTRPAAPARFRAPRVVRWAAIGIVIGASSVYAATLIRSFSPPSQVESTAPASVTAASPRATKLQARPRAAADTQAAPAPEPTADAAASPQADAPADANAAATATPREQSSRGAAPVPSADQWKRAARGLRDGDFQSANAALRELTRRGSEGDRESALLVQAQVLMAQGKDAEAESLLKSLEASAHASSVRRKSSELLARLRERPSSRSAKSRAGTELP